MKRYTIGRHGSPSTPDIFRTETKRLLIQVGQGIDVASIKHEKARRAPDSLSVPTPSASSSDASRDAGPTPGLTPRRHSIVTQSRSFATGLFLS